MIENSEDLLNALRERGVRNKEVQSLLGLSSSRTADLFTRKRRVLFDEGLLLMRHFRLNDPDVERQEHLESLEREPLTIQAAEQVVVQALGELGLDPREHADRVSDAARTVQALAKLLARPELRSALRKADLAYPKPSQERVA